MYRKGVYKGNSNVNSTLTEEQVRTIKVRLLEGESAASLARVYLVSAETIRRIARGETWGWLDLGKPVAQVKEVLEQPVSEEEKERIAESHRKLQELLRGGN